MPVVWDKKKLLDMYAKRADDVCTVVGAQAATWAADQLRDNGSVVTGNLVNSIAYSTDKTKGPTRGKSSGASIEKPTKRHSVRVGSNVSYAARVEFGFIGRDSLGRNYHQAAKSWLRSSLAKNTGNINKIVQEALRG